MPRPATDVVHCEVELFGMARLATGRRQVPLDLPGPATLRDVTRALATSCPALLGKAVTADLAGLVDGYVFNVNGFSFAASLDATVSSGDCVLLLSDQAGG